MKILWLTLSLFPLLGAAQTNSEFLRCRIKKPGLEAVFRLDTIGAGQLTVIQESSGTAFHCALRLTGFSDSRRAINPKVEMTFERQACDPVQAQLEAELLKPILMKVELKRSRDAKGRALVQWLSREQPEYCTMEKLDLDNVATNAKKWREGHWGRSTASQPRKSR